MLYFPHILLPTASRLVNESQWLLPSHSSWLCSFLHPASAKGVLVLASSFCLSVCVCVSVSLSRLNGQTYILAFWHVGQVERYLGQVWRSRSWVKGQGHQVKNSFLITVIQQKPGSDWHRWCLPGRPDADEAYFLHGISDPGCRLRHHTWMVGYDAGCFQSICGFFCHVFMDYF